MPVKRMRVTFSSVRDPAALGEALTHARVLESGFDFYHLEVPAGTQQPFQANNRSDHLVLTMQSFAPSANLRRGARNLGHQKVRTVR